jgi:bifunctional pyridoxal-dependent enzyme with beta-cystathionase and maltose regulon repressor activities
MRRPGQWFMVKTPLYKPFYQSVNEIRMRTRNTGHIMSLLTA